MASSADISEVVAVRLNLSFPEQHIIAKASEDVDYVAMPKASCQRASILLYLGKSGYDIKLVHTDGFMRAMSQLKWSIPNPSSSTAIDLFDGPAADLLRQVVKDLRALYAIEPILSFLKDTFYDVYLDPQLPSQISSTMTTTTMRAPMKVIPR